MIIKEQIKKAIEYVILLVSKYDIEVNMAIRDVGLNEIGVKYFD